MTSVCAHLMTFEVTFDIVNNILTDRRELDENISFVLFLCFVIQSTIKVPKIIFQSMNILNMTEEDIKSTLRIVSAVLHFGNMEFKKERGNDQATMPDNTVAQKVCQLLRLDINNFTRALLRPKIKVIILLPFVFDFLSLHTDRSRSSN